jgi:hypothetical protein
LALEGLINSILDFNQAKPVGSEQNMKRINKDQSLNKNQVVNKVKPEWVWIKIIRDRNESYWLKKAFDWL